MPNLLGTVALFNQKRASAVPVPGSAATNDLLSLRSGVASCGGPAAFDLNTLYAWVAGWVPVVGGTYTDQGGTSGGGGE